MSDENMDFSLLDPARDEERWNKLVESVARRAWDVRRQQLTVSFQIVSWARPALAIAASLALVSWAVAWAQPPAATSSSGGANAGSSAEKEQDPSALLAQWAVAEEMPTTLEILRILGARHGTD